jgi:acetylornithine aminotransferase
MLGTTFGGNHLACAAALAVVEVMASDNLMANSLAMGNFLIQQLSEIPELEKVRGRGLMIGFDVPEKIKDLKKRLLTNQQIFTGEAKPNVIRLLPSLALNKKDADSFIDALNEEIAAYEIIPTTVKA